MIRLKPGDVEGVEHGLYACCQACFDQHQARVGARMGVEPSTLSEYQLC